MKLTVTLKNALRASEAVIDNCALRRKLTQVSTNVWEVIGADEMGIEDSEKIATELDETMERAGISPAEYSIEL